MKVIELLNRIANGEEVPKKIKYMEYTFELEDNEYIPITNDYHGEDLFDYIDFIDLNNEVEIIEEDKKIEKLKPDVIDDNNKAWYKLDTLADKINEIIDVLNKHNITLEELSGIENE